MIQNLRRLLFASIFLIVGVSECFAQPAAPGAISGGANGATVCFANTSPIALVRTYSVSTVTGALSYTWSYSGTGVSFANGAKNISVTYATNATSGNWTVTATNGSGTSGSSPAFAVAVGTSPAIPGAYTTSSGSVCPGQINVPYEVPVVAGATSYNWTYTGGTGATFSGTSNSVTVNFSGSATTGTVNVAAVSGSCSSANTSKKTVTVNPAAPVTPGSITGVTPVCQGTGSHVYSVAAVTNATSYTWTYTGTGTSITSGATTRSITVNYSASATSGNWSCTATNSCGTSGSSPAFAVIVSPGTPSVPGSISGVSPVCQGVAGSVYSVSAVTNATSYTWTYTGTGESITSGDNTNAITVTYSASAAAGDWTVAASNTCGTSGLSTPYSVVINTNDVLSVTSPQDVNLGASLTLNAPNGAADYAWTGPDSFSDNTQNPLVTNNALPVNEGDYTLTGTNANGCFNTYTVTVNVISDENIFRSSASGDFSDVSIWQSSSDGVIWNAAAAIPSETSTTVTIVSGHTVTMDVAATVINLVIEGTLTADASNVLTVTGDFTNDGTFVHSNGTIAFSGDNSNVISGAATSTDFYNLLIDKTSDATMTVQSVVTLKEKLSFGTSATNELFVYNGNGGVFTFLSDASSTAHVDVLTSPLPYLTGSFTCQHYFPAQSGRYVFMLGVPVTDTYVSDLQPTQFDGTLAPTDGIFVTGAFTGSDVGNGLTVFAPSSFSYDPSTGLYSSYPVPGGETATAPLAIGSGYRHSVRDGGSAYPTVVAKTLTVSGSLVSPGDFTYNGLVNGSGTKPFASNNITGGLTGGWNLVSNPYMSDISIDFSDANAWTLSNVSSTSYVYDAAIKDFTACNNSFGTCEIAAFQGFWIQATGTPSLTVHEEAKISGTNNTSIKRVAQSNVAKNAVTIKLTSKSVSTPTNTYVRYTDGASLAKDNFDGPKLGATNRSCLAGAVVCLYTKAIDGMFYAINAKPSGLLTDTTQINVIAPDGNATLDFSDLSFESKYQATLIDNYTNAKVNLLDSPVYNFVVTNSDTNTWGPRFRLVITDISNITTDLDEDKSFNNGSAAVYPSPGTADKVNVYLNSDGTDAEFLIYDMTGRLVFNSKLNLIGKKAFQVFDLSRILQSGIYSTVVKSSNASYSQKLIIR